jgi:hypothetical protein
MTEDEYKRVIAGRLTEYVALFRSQNDFARKIEVPVSTMSAFMSTLRGYSVPFAVAQHCPEVSLEWLFRGEGAMLLADRRTDQPQEPEPPRPGNDPELVRILLDRIETQAVELSRLREENDRFKRALGVF